ncbi:zinc metalloprotease HtpX [Desulfovermiculus halophilus]|uniref:zinc metalloprotease HtpX n=1 Tax=Desulfovermiculus halophilus TaxID=339722 RepID=UPI00048435F5|nr:zinc metalloprotease HtpX [Desulfovermiculus halophilus]
MTNQLKTGLLLGLLTAIILLFGQMLGGQGGLVLAFIIAIAMNVGSYWYSDRIVLSMYKAKEVSPSDAPRLHEIVAELAQRAGVPKPRVFIIPQEAPNAFATGRTPKQGVVAVTKGIMQLLTMEELKGVLAHEMGHIRNRDILIQTVAATLAGVIMFVSNMLQWAAIFGMGGNDEEGGGNPLVAIVMAIVAPIAAMLIQMAISRSREYLADQTGAQLAGDPRSLASALEKLDAYSRRIPMQSGTPATAHMFIVNPFSGGSMAHLFSTHPPVQERIQRLRAMSGQGGQGG